MKKCNFENTILYQKDHKKKIGTNFYKGGVFTNGGILLNPGKLLKSMVNALPENVRLFENTTLLKWKKSN